MKIFPVFCLTGLFTILLLPAYVKCQKTPTDCYLMLYQVDQLLKSGDTLMALHLFDAIDENKCDFNGHRYYKMSKVLFSQGAIEDSKKMVKKAVEEGLLGIEHFYEVKNSESIREVYGDSFYDEMMQMNDSIIKEKLELHGELIYALKDILEYDQAIRSVEEYYEVTSYELRYRLGRSLDTTLNHEHMMTAFKVFRHKDSLNLQKFVDIIADLGHVPGRDMVFDLVPIPPLIIHTAQKDFKTLDSLYRVSVEKGTLSPSYYGWYHGYHTEYFKKEDQYYFTYVDKLFNEMSDDQIKEVNRRRLEMGLPPCPGAVWNTHSY